jgi:hypothetical protein
LMLTALGRDALLHTLAGPALPILRRRLGI